MLAVGEYIKTLREEQQLTQAQVIERLAKYIGGRKIDQTTLWRWETGQRTPKGDALDGLLKVLEGNRADVSELFDDPVEAPGRGHDRAVRWLRRDQHEHIDAIVETTPPEELDSIIEELRREYQKNPSLLSHLRSFLAGWHGAVPRR